MLRIGTRSNRCLSNTQPLKVKVLQVLAIHDEIAGLPVENVHHVGGDVHAHSALCFNRRRTDVRRTVKVFHLKKRVVRVNRFLLEHIESGRCQHAAFEGGNHCVFVHDTTACTIDDVTPASSTVFADVRHRGQSLSVDQVVRFLGQVAVNGYVGAV